MESWFFGESGFNKIKELNDSLRKKTLEYSSSRIQSNFSHYSPWMSHIEKLKELSPLFTRKDLILFHGEDLKLLEAEYLQSDLEKLLTFGRLPENEEYLLNHAIQELQETQTDIAKIFDELILHVVPMNTEKGNFQKIGNGFSTHRAKGALFISVPQLGTDSLLQLKINLAHELGHQSLFVYQSADPIIKEGLDAPVYSYVRQTERPAIQAFHATVALGFMVRFLEQTTDCSDYYLSSLQRLKEDFVKSLQFYDRVVFTDIGQMLFKDLKSYAARL